MGMLLAYGEFRSFETWDMFWACMPHFLHVVIPAIVLYGVCSGLAERRATRWFAIPAWCIVCKFLPPIGVMGAFGPAHVALRYSAPAWPLLFGVLVLKVILYARRR